MENQDDWTTTDASHSGQASPRDKKLRPETADRATGYWTTRSDRAPGLNARTAGVYLRADPSDLQVLDSGSEEARAQLIGQRLREWKSAANAF